MPLCTLQSVFDTLPTGWIVVGIKTFPHLPPGHTAYAVDLRCIVNGETAQSYEFTPNDAWATACRIARAIDLKTAGV